MLRDVGIFVCCLVMAFAAGKYQERQAIKAEVNRIESSMRDEAAATTAKLEKEKRDAQTKVDQLRADVAAGAVRLSVRASCSTGASTGDQKREPNLTQRLLTTLSPSQQTATKPSSN